MAYTVKEVADMSGVSVRTLHFYDELGLLKPAWQGANGYRYYEQRQLVALQQILFYRELGFELKQIQEILGRGDGENAAALERHRKVLKEDLARTRTLMDTLDKTIEHLRGAKEMSTEEIFRGFSVPAGRARFGETIRLGGEPNDCKVSAKDTGGAICVFEFTGSGGGPRHSHDGEDEWIYVVEGEFLFELGKEQFQLGPGESIFVPRQTAHSWATITGKPGKIIDVYQPAGKMEEFFRAVGKYVKPLIHEALTLDEMRQLFHEHGMKIAGPPVAGEWHVDEDGRITRTA